MKKRANPAQIAFGDWQTPIALANQVVDLLRKLDFHPKTLLEPTCGKGAFLQASLKAWEEAERFGFEINATYVQAAQETLHSKATIKQQNFFAVDWHQFFQEKHSPYLIIGNPPWVTSAELSTVNAQTVPPKKNHNYSGYDAITGKSNFDMILH